MDFYYDIVASSELWTDNTNRAWQMLLIGNIKWTGLYQTAVWHRLPKVYVLLKSIQCKDIIYIYTGNSNTCI